ncbi:MAG TPA: DUF1573 domain-containing protein [Pirellulaceae bacterium]
MVWRTFWTAFAVMAVMVVSGVAMAWSATFLFTHPGARDVRVVIDRRTGGAIVAAFAAPESGIKLIKPEPRAEAPERDFDFGLLDPGISGKHAFAIKNTGDETLELKLGGTTCKCTISGVSDSRVSPGKSATMTMEWNTGRYDPKFAQSAMILTNDPLHKQIEFTVKGQIRALVTTEPKEVTLPTIVPCQHGEGEVVVYSQMWPDFEITGASSQLGNLEWTAEPISDPPAHLSASSAKLVKFRFDSPVPFGSFHEQIRLDIKPEGDAESMHHQYVNVSGQALRRLSFYGQAIDGNGVVEFGNLTEGNGKRIKIIAKVRDTDLVISQPDVQVFPEFLKAEFRRHEGEAKGLYELILELPSDLPPCQYNSDPVGRVKIDTHHPRIGEIQLLVQFAVVPRRSLAD